MVNGKDVNYFPEKATFSKVLVNCDNEAIGEWDTDKWGIIVTNLKQSPTVCKVDFIVDTYNYEYTGSEQTFSVPIDGTYKIELWGASGASISSSGGKGSYTSGNIKLEKNKILYIYVGQQGDRDQSAAYGSYTFNGGSRGSDTCKEYQDSIGSPGKINDSGGGATDVRLTGGNWKDFDSLKSRIMVAASGSGSFTISGAPGGGLNGYDGGHGTGATQISAGGPNKGGFGYGGTPAYGGHICENSVEVGAGSGYYGGGAASSNCRNCGNRPAGSGSSFISGHEGCDAITAESTSDNIQHTGKSIHYSGLYFTETKMVDGAGYSWTTEKGDLTEMPTHDGSDGTMVGNTGNGYARITYIG